MQLEEMINDHYNELNENDLYIWNYILHHKEECKNISIQELASKCNVSHTTINRFTKKIGLEGYSELKIYLKWDSRKKEEFNSSEIEKAYQDFIKTMDVVRNQDLTKIFKMLKLSRKIYAYGSGAVQKNAVKDLKRVMVFAGHLIHTIEGRDETNVILNHVHENDVVFLYSLSGNNSFMNEFAQRLKARNVRIISVTQVGNNELSRLSDVSIQFYCHPIVRKEHGNDLYMVSQFFLINEFLLLKLLDYQQF
ncbi:MAG: MurR/RpiR family transcriptional regulator [Floccifex porci]|uniref:MurR/RpiR family transcriptional regulator n=1 Tax=Bacillota TaxID=1239 RepID=UPI003F0D62C7